jgi:hypothetical protein
MNGFKLIAIRPLLDCNKKFLKNLNGGEIYNFYNDYRFLNDKNKTVRLDEDIFAITYKPTTPDNLFNIKRNNGKEIAINISAIVGKNGSGKSSISELLLYSLFIISNKFGYIDKNNFLETESNNIEDREENERYDRDVADISNGFKAQLFYLLNNTFYKVLIADNEITAYTSLINKNDHAFIPVNFQKNSDLFFYTILVNYSFYAFNTNQIGVWINAFFHKNDGYQMPIVINPYREKGNMDVNIENLLTSSRLLANILSISKYKKINPKSPIDKIELYFNANKDYTVLKNGEPRFTGSFIEKFRKLILIPLYNIHFNNEVSYPLIDTDLKNYAEIYLIHKLITIPSKYKSFEGFNKRIRKKESPDNYELIPRNAAKYVKELYEDRTHITLKVRQTLNFLRKDIYEIPGYGDFKQTLDLSTVVKKINSIQSEDWFTESIDYLPPPFMFSRIKFKDGSYFDELSSGEKQKISSLNSIIYHLKNLDSVHKSGRRNSNTEIITHDTINLLFDEVELYYHPELQKTTISDLLLLIKEANFDYIKNINIVFLTHSPFILSDIPIQNTILLDIDSKTGQSKQILHKKQSFGANIHDLLADNFFLTRTLIGKHADQKITSLINKVKKGNYKKTDCILLNLIGDTFLKSSIKQFEENYDKNSD